MVMGHFEKLSDMSMTGKSVFSIRTDVSYHWHDRSRGLKFSNGSTTKLSGYRHIREKQYKKFKLPHVLFYTDTLVAQKFVSAMHLADAG